MLTKASFVLTFALALLAVAHISADSKASEFAIESRADPLPLNVGARVNGDRLLAQDLVIKESSWLSVITQDYTFTTLNKENITLVNASNRKFNGYGASAALIGGGPGQKFVTLRFTSQRSHGINYTVSVYGK